VKNTPDYENTVKTIVGEITTAQYEGEIRAIAAVVIKKNGDVRTLVAYQEGALRILAGTVVLQHQLVNDIKPVE